MARTEDYPNRDIDIPFRFRRRPTAIPAEFRPDWKIAELLLILEISSYGGKSTLKRLHLLNWAVRSLKYQAEFHRHLENSTPLFGFTVRFEPGFAKAIDLAVGEELVQWVGGNRLQITPKGKRWVAEIKRDPSLMQKERAFLEAFGKRVTEKIAEEILGMRGAL
jgi:hypothetical protein